MPKLKAIIILYPGESSVERIHKSANYSLSRILVQNEKIGVPIYFFNYSKNEEKLGHLHFLSYSRSKLLKLVLKLGFSKEVLVISQTDKYDSLAVMLKKIMGYRVMLRAGGIYYGKKVIDASNFKQREKRSRYIKHIDAFLSTADGTSVTYYAQKIGIPTQKVYAWMNGFPQILNTKGYQRQNQVVCISRLSREKSIDYVLKSFALALPSFKETYNLHIIGDGPDRERLEQLAITLGIKDHVFFEGQSHDIEKWLYSSKLSLTGLANNTVIEAIVTNTPVICVDLGEMNLLYKEFKNVFIMDYPTGGYGKISEEDMPNLVTQTANTMVNILNQYEIQPNDIDWNKFGWENRIRKEIELYHSLIAE